MRLAILADIHGNLGALEAVAADLRRRGADRVVNLGDSLSGPLLPKETAQFLMARDWVHLAGNHERQVLTLGPDQQGASDRYTRAQLGPAELDWLASLRPAQALDGEVFLCHGTPASDQTHFLATVEPGGLRDATPAEIEERLGGLTASLVACGHTHLARRVRSARGQLILNPGSVGLQAYADTQPSPYTVENGCPDAQYAIVEKRSDQWCSQLISVPYGAKAMAQLAGLREARDWVSALRSGYLPRA